MWFRWAGSTTNHIIPFYALGGSELKSTGRHSSDEGGCANSHWVIMMKESRKENARTFFLQTEPTFQWGSPCDLHIETAWIWRGCLGKKEPLRSSLTSQGCSKKTPKSLPSKQPLDYISPVFYSDYTSVTLFTYIRISSHPTTALISKYYFYTLFCHQETIHLLASRSAIVMPWSWALAGDSNSDSNEFNQQKQRVFSTVMADGGYSKHKGVYQNREPLENHYASIDPKKNGTVSAFLRSVSNQFKKHTYDYIYSKAKKSNINEHVYSMQQNANMDLNRKNYVREMTNNKNTVHTLKKKKKWEFHPCGGRSGWKRSWNNVRWGLYADMLILQPFANLGAGWKKARQAFTTPWSSFFASPNRK